MLCRLILLQCATLVLANSVPSASPTGLSSGSAPPQPTASGCTTLDPIFGVPSDGTSTVFATVVTAFTPGNCRGCTPTVRTFNYSKTDPPPSPTTTITNTTPLTIYEVSCLPFTPSAALITTAAPAPPVVSETASPIPPISAEAEKLIDELRTVNLYVLLIANGGFQDVLCSGLNPPLLSNNTGIDGNAVQNEVCFSAGIRVLDPTLFPLIVTGNQIAAKSVVEIALYAAQVAAGYGGVTASKADLQKLCDEIDETRLNAVFAAYIAKEGSVIKKFVCDAAK